MSALVLTVLLGAAPVPATSPAFDRSELLAAMQSCGFKSLTMQYEDDVQSEVLTVYDEAASDTALACAISAIDGSGVLLFFEADYLAARSFEIQDRMFRPRALERSRNWLAERGLLSEVPNFTASSMSDLTFARKIETICGPAATGALDGNANPHQFNYVFLEQTLHDESKRWAFECIMHVAMISGFEIGFIGNEAVRDK